MRIARPFVVFTLIALVVRCGDSSGPPTVANLIIVPDTIRVGRLDSLHLTVSAVDAGGRAVTGATITFVSGDTTLLRVGPTGWVRSVGPVGATLVTVTSQSISRPLAAFVLALPRTVVMTPADTTIQQQGSFFLTTTVRDGAGDAIVGAPLTFESLNPGVLSVSPLGYVTTVGPAGAGVVVAHSGTLADSAAITVAAVAQSIVVTPPGGAAHQGDSVQFTAVVRDRNADVMAGATVTWQSSDTVVATVTSGGLARARTPGNAFISALYQAAFRSVPISVIDSTILARVPVPSPALGIAASGNVAYVVRESANKVDRLNLATDTYMDSIAVGALPIFVTFNAAGTTAYVTNFSSHSVGRINVATHTQTSSIPVNGDPVPVVVSADGNTLFVTTDANRLYKIALANDSVVDSIALPATSHHLLMHPNDTLLYVATRDAGTVLEVNWRTMTIARTFTLGGRPQGMAISQDTQELYVANETANVLQIVTLASGTTATPVTLAGGGEGLALSADGTKLYVGLVFAGKVQVIDRVGRTVLRTITTGGTPREVATDAPRSRILVANEAGWVDIIH